MSAWQPIETAPKDSVPILVWSKRCKTDGCGSIADAGIYIADFMTLKPARHSYWRNWERHRYEYENYVLKPTHWMPLPEPPV